MRQKTFLALAGFLALLIVFPLVAYAAEQLIPGTYYVDINQTSEGDGSQSSPWRTLHNGIQQINGGTSGTYILNVAAGTYSLTNEEDDSQLILTQGYVTIQGAVPGNMPVLDGAEVYNWYEGIIIEASNVTIKNVAVKGFGDWGIRISSGSGAIIENCEIYDNGFIEHGGGIHVENCSPDIRKNKIHDNSPAGIFIAGNGAEASPNIERNEIHGNTVGISVNGYSAGGSAAPSITNNLIYDTGSTMTYGIQVSGAESGNASPFIYHNTIDGGASHGIYILDLVGTTTPNIQYNIITNFGDYGIYNSLGIPTIDYNDVWNNGQDNYFGCDGLVGVNDISENPLYGTYKLQTGSPCIDKITTDPVTVDFAGYTRPKGEGYDMGAYEFIPDIAHDFELPGGTGDPTDYSMFTVPVELHTGASLKQAMEEALGDYDKGIWRVFAWDSVSSSYIELDDDAFANLPVYPGRGFWVISTLTDTITFSGKPAPDGGYLDIPLSPGWNMVALPWPSTSIYLDEILVSDGIANWGITNPDNPLTQQCVWDYTGTEDNNGYEQLITGATLQPGKAYWIKVLGAAEITMLVPNYSEGQSEALSLQAVSRVSRALEYTELPPAPPGVSGGGTTVSGSAGCFIGTVAPME